MSKKSVSPWQLLSCPWVIFHNQADLDWIKRPGQAVLLVTGFNFPHPGWEYHAINLFLMPETLERETLRMHCVKVSGFFEDRVINEVRMALRNRDQISEFQHVLGVWTPDRRYPERIRANCRAITGEPLKLDIAGERELTWTNPVVKIISIGRQVTVVARSL